MNARVSPESLFTASCPAAILATQLAAAAAELERLDNQPSPEALDVDRRTGELFDLEDKLMADAEYVTPKSAHGAMLLVVLMGRAARAAFAPDGETDEDPQQSKRRFYRLQARLLDYLAAQSGATVEGLGLSPFHLSYDALPSGLVARPPKASGVARTKTRA